jgi:hypothetical protein
MLKLTLATILVGVIMSAVGHWINQFVLHKRQSKLIVFILTIAVFLLSNFTLFTAKLILVDFESIAQSGKFFAISQSLLVSILFYYFLTRKIEIVDKNADSNIEDIYKDLDDEQIIYRIGQRLFNNDALDKALTSLTIRGYKIDEGKILNKEGTQVATYEKAKTPISRIRYVAAFIFTGLCSSLLADLMIGLNIPRLVDEPIVALIVGTAFAVSVIVFSFYFTFFILFRDLLLHHIMAWFYLFGTLGVLYESGKAYNKAISPSNLPRINLDNTLYLNLTIWVVSVIIIRYIARHRIKER